MEYQKLFLNKLKNTFVYKEIINNLVLIYIEIVLVLLTINNIFFIFGLLVYSFYLKKVNFVIFKTSIILVSLVLVNLYLKNIDREFILQEQLKIYDIEKREDYQRIIIKDKDKKIIIYDFDNNNLKPGYLVSVKVSPSEILKERIEGGFNNEKYLLNNNIIASYVLKEVEVLKKGANINTIKYNLLQYINNNFKGNSRSFLKGLILGEKYEFSPQFSLSLKGNGIIHLFAISGLHVGILAMFLKKLLDFLKVKEQEIIISIILLLYLVITSFSPSITRAVIMYLLVLINKRLKLSFSIIDIVSLTFIFMVLINPLLIYNMGFVLSFLVTTFIVLFTPLVNKRQALYISIASYILTLPIIINMNNEINLLSPFVNVIFIFLVSFIILPLSFFIIFFPSLGNLYNLITEAFITSSIFFDTFISIKINIASLSKFLVAFYYYLLIVLTILIIKKSYKKVSIIMIIMFCFLFLYKPYKKNDEIHFLDLDEGDATLIINNSSECVALIDTGTGENDEVTKFLKRKGIKRLDYLILTHNHADHNGEANKIISEINVNKIVVSEYDNSVFGNYRNSIKVKKGDKIKCGEMDFEVLNPSKNNYNDNDNSIVLHTNINGKYFLFAADISKKIEEDIKSNLKVDCLKVAHHGSKTSTSKEFINKINPQYAVIMTGRKKIFGFPHKETINILKEKNVTIYRTDTDYTIIYDIKKQRFKKSSQ